MVYVVAVVTGNTWDGYSCSSHTSPQHTAQCAGVDWVEERDFGYTSWDTFSLFSSWHRVLGISLRYCTFVERSHPDSDTSMKQSPCRFRLLPAQPHKHTWAGRAVQHAGCCAVHLRLEHAVHYRGGWQHSRCVG